VSIMSATHPARLISVPLTVENNASPYGPQVPLEPVWGFPSELPTHGVRCPGDQWAAPPYSPHAGSDVFGRVPTIVPFLDPYGGPQSSGSAPVQSQPHLDPNNMFVPGVQGLAPPMDWPAPHYSSGVEQQQSAPHNYPERINSRDDFANANTEPMSSGSSDEMSDNEWTGTLNLNGTRVSVRALMAEAIGDPYVYAFVKLESVSLGDLHAYRNLWAFPNELEVELPVDLNLTTLDIQIWIRENKAPVARLSYVNGADNRDFDWLVEKIRTHSVSRPSYSLSPLATLTLLTACNCEVGK
jgi:hypothetical protein